jgi:hypothetical protein
VLAAVIYVAGLVVTLRRWHYGMGARLGAVGFGLLTLNIAAVQTASLVLWLLGAYSAGGLPWPMLLSSVSAILIAAGHVALVLALRSALGPHGQPWDSPAVEPEDRWSAFGDDDEPL